MTGIDLLYLKCQKVQSMDLFIGNLEMAVSEGDLRLLFKGYEKRTTFKIIRMEGDEEGGSNLVYGIVSIDSDRLAKKAIKKLNYKKIHGRMVIIREFHYRASQNDKRALNWRMKGWENEERRGRERRQKRKAVKNLDDYEISGMSGFSRKYK